MDMDLLYFFIYIFLQSDYPSSYYLHVIENMAFYFLDTYHYQRKQFPV